MKGKEKLTWTNKLLVDWVTKFDERATRTFDFSHELVAQHMSL